MGFMFTYRLLAPANISVSLMKMIIATEPAYIVTNDPMPIVPVTLKTKST
jgi:hypothetical protein